MSDFLSDAIEVAGGVCAVARACGLSSVAVTLWKRRGFLPRTEWTGETNYAAIIEQLTHRQFTKRMLLSRAARKGKTA